MLLFIYDITTSFGNQLFFPPNSESIVRDLLSPIHSDVNSYLKYDNTDISIIANKIMIEFSNENESIMIQIIITDKIYSKNNIYPFEISCLNKSAFPSDCQELCEAVNNVLIHNYNIKMKSILKQQLVYLEHEKDYVTNTKTKILSEQGYYHKRYLWLTFIAFLLLISQPVLLQTIIDKLRCKPFKIENSRRDDSTHYELFLIIVIIIGILGFSIRMIGLGELMIDFDELNTMYLAPDYAYRLPELRSHPPLYFQFIAKIVKQSQNLFWVRLPSAIIGALSIIIIGLLTAKLANYRVGIWMATLLTISTYHIRYSQMARHYVFLMLLHFIGLFLFIFACRFCFYKYWIGFILTVWITMNFHYSELIGVLFYVVCWFIYSLLRRNLGLGIIGAYNFGILGLLLYYPIQTGFLDQVRAEKLLSIADFERDFQVISGYAIPYTSLQKLIYLIIVLIMIYLYRKNLNFIKFTILCQGLFYFVVLYMIHYLDARWLYYRHFLVIFPIFLWLSVNVFEQQKAIVRYSGYLLLIMFLIKPLPAYFSRNTDVRYPYFPDFKVQKLLQTYLMIFYAYDAIVVDNAAYFYFMKYYGENKLPDEIDIQRHSPCTVSYLNGKPLIQIGKPEETAKYLKNQGLNEILALTKGSSITYRGRVCDLVALFADYKLGVTWYRLQKR